MRFLLITAQLLLIIVVAQVVAFIVIQVMPESHFSKTMAIALIPLILLFAHIFRDSRSGIFDALKAVSTNFGFAGKASDFLLGIYSVILLLFLFTLSHYIWTSWTV